MLQMLIWFGIGILVALFLGAGPRRRPFRPNTNTALFAGAFGAMIGGMISDGVPGTALRVSLTSLIGALIGALIFCWAVRERASDV